MATTVLGLKTFAASDPVDYNEINDNYNKIDSGVKTAFKGRAAHDFLNNSDFRNPVNHRGKTSYTGAGYTIDRWKAGASNCSMNVNAGESVTFNTKTEGVNAYWRQYLPYSLSQLGGKTFTIAIKDAWGKTHCATGVYPSSAPSETKSVIWLNMYDNVSIVLYCSTDGTAFVQLTTKTPVAIVWVALYEGSYTADTLPAYQPKGYAAELAECQRYYRQMSYPVIPCGNNPAGTQVYGFLPFVMRIANPTVACDSLYFFKGDTTFCSVTSASAATYGAGTRIVFNLSQSVEGNLAGAVAGNSITLNADL